MALPGPENPLALPFDQYQRYRLAADIIEKIQGDDGPMAVLEVGGWPPRLHLFLPDNEIKTVDRVDGEAPGYQKADALDLPFKHNEFDAVISLDVLEHIAPDDRPRFLSELCRVSKAVVVLAAPFYSDMVRAADLAVHEFVKSRTGVEQKFLREHVETDLPAIDETVKSLENLGRSVKTLESGRIDRWMLMMTIYYTLDSDPDQRESLPLVMETYNRAFYEMDKAGPSYRHFMVGVTEDRKDALDKVATLSGSSPEAGDGEVAAALELVRSSAIKVKDERMNALTEELVRKEEELTDLKEHVSKLEDFVGKVKSLPGYSLYEKILKPVK